MSSNSVTLDPLRCSLKVTGHSSTTLAPLFRITLEWPLQHHYSGSFCACAPRLPSSPLARHRIIECEPSLKRHNTCAQSPPICAWTTEQPFEIHPSTDTWAHTHAHTHTHTHQESPTSRTSARGTTGRRSLSLAPRITPPPLTPGPLAAFSRSSFWARCVLAPCALTRHPHAHALTHSSARGRSRMHACSCARIVCMLQAHV